MMDKELKAKWVAALRSGDYKQGHGFLRTQRDEYCCLGVLCAVQNAPFEPTSHGAYWVGSRYATPPEEYRGGLNRIYTLIEMNDNERKSFEQIADYIEEYL